LIAIGVIGSRGHLALKRVMLAKKQDSGKSQTKNEDQFETGFMSAARDFDCFRHTEIVFV
jgi:hypothetical protein